jgi:hypothetical protein
MTYIIHNGLQLLRMKIIIVLHSLLRAHTYDGQFQYNPESKIFQHLLMVFLHMIAAFQQLPNEPIMSHVSKSNTVQIIAM